MAERCPVVLVIGGNDPVGGAGLCADTQTLAQHACHAAPVVTAITVQTSCGVTGFTRIDPGLVASQVACVLEDMPVDAIKTGMLASREIAREIGKLSGQHPQIPLIIDPVMASNTGDDLGEQSLVESVMEFLLPSACIVTPNLPELQAMARSTGCRDADISSQAASLGVPLLVTGTHDATSVKVINRLFRQDRETVTWEWERLAGEFHGSGCTLASALAANLAHDAELAMAAADAQLYTWQTLKDGLMLGACQRTPNRLGSRPRVR